MKKIIIIIMSLVIALLIGLTVFIGVKLYSVNQELKRVEDKLEKTSDKSEEKPSKGSTILYAVVDADGNAIDKVPSNQMNEMISILKIRLDSFGYHEAIVSKQGDNKISVNIPNVEVIEPIMESLGQIGRLTFRDADGNILVDSSHVKEAKCKYGVVDDSTGEDENYVEIKFTTEGQKVFADATEQVAARAGSDENYLCIYIDETLYSAPRVMERIDADTAIISGDINKENAKELADIISSGALPFGLEEVQVITY